ncbi:hypothetical protein BDA96_10G160300 [Sorghum bicolor]|uniref:Uncharacterized protein n=1 Tax=Sorghum bicolor TaxID=4558 RepID=A0A921U0X5_SORBI|nr:hypothetical protein BDA96_10G160300 [Sorghum bicolor]
MLMHSLDTTALQDLSISDAHRVEVVNGLATMNTCIKQSCRSSIMPWMVLILLWGASRVVLMCTNKCVKYLMWWSNNCVYEFDMRCFIECVRTNHIYI